MPYKKSSYSILMIDDNEDDHFLLLGLLATMGDIFKLDWIQGYEYGIEAVMTNSHDLYLIDDRIVDRSGLEFIREIRAFGIDKPVILLTPMASKELDIEALKSGASDFLVKSSLSARDLEHSLRHCIQRFEYTKMYQESQRLLHSFFTTNIAPTFIMDENCVLKETNPAFQIKFGNDKVDTLIAGIFADQEDFDFNKKSLQVGRPFQTWSTFLIDKEQNRIESSLNIFRYHAETDNRVHYFGVINDISQLRKAEKQLALAEQVNMTGKMARIMAHEIRNPLTNINLAADQLREELEALQVSAENLEFVEIIKRNSQRINNLIKELLNSTKETKFQKSKTDLAGVIRDALKLVDDRIILKKIQLKVDKLIDGILLELDEQRLKMAFLNILTNAIEAMETKEIKKLEIVMTTDDSDIRVTISDTGVGMSEEDKKRIFEPFYTRRSGGVGLGMTTVLHVLTAHDASIHIDSTTDKGTKFQILFPKPG
ncbi:MAG: two-component system sensor histidine kinase NtrB [Bacteroidia bacterium]